MIESIQMGMLAGIWVSVMFAGYYLEKIVRLLELSSRESRDRLTKSPESLL
jgi:hypothetical protein